MAKLINGNGNPAIYAAEDADLIASLAGNVTCISNVGNKYAATEEDATTIRLDDGVIITKEGRRIQLEAGESDTFYIPTGTSGQTNYYIIGYKLVQNADSTQVAEQFVQKMNSSSETITEGTFRGGATEVYVSVYRVTQVDFTITSITGLLPELLDSNSAKDDIAQINSDLSDVKKYKYVAFSNPISVTSSGTIIELDSTMIAHDDILLYGGIATLNTTFRCIPFPKFSSKAFGFCAFWSATQYVSGSFIYYRSPTPKITITENMCVGFNSGSFNLYGYFYR